MKRLILFFMILLSSCGREAEQENQSHQKQVQIDPELRPYVVDFLLEANKRDVPIEVDDLIMKFQKLQQPSGSKTILGKCWYGGTNNTPLIIMDTANWDRLSDQKREMIVFHELGHCLLNRRHVENEDSIMSPTGVKISYYVACKDMLLDELFDKDKIILKLASTLHTYIFYEKSFNLDFEFCKL